MPDTGTPPLLFAGVGRNFSASLPCLIRACMVMEEILPGWRFLIYENNSDDATKTGLADLVRQFPKITIQSEDLSEEQIRAASKARTWDNQPCRMELIARARNCLMEMIERPEFSGFPYVVLCDLDNFSPIPVALIARIVRKYDGAFDALIANGFDEIGRMYDAYAYRDARYPAGPEVLGEAFWCPKNMRCLLRRIMPWRKLMPILSGFNGLCVLRREAMMGLRYSALPEPQLDRFYRSIDMRARQHAMGIGLKDGHALFGEDGVIYLNNSGYDLPVVCEHANFFLAMRQRGFGRIFLCPRLIWKWKRCEASLARLVVNKLGRVIGAYMRQIAAVIHTKA